MSGYAWDDFDVIGSSRYANLLIDTADKLAAAGNDQEIWETVVAISRRIGAKAVGAGALMKDSRDLVWMRSSASDEWFEDYRESELYRVDPLLRGAIAGKMPEFLDTSKARPTREEQARRHLQAAALLNGYRYFIGRMMPLGATDQVVVLYCGKDPTSHFGPGTQRFFTAISTMLSLALQPPGRADADDLSFGSGWPLLTQEERDMLCFSGVGLSPVEVAERLHVTQEHVLRQIRNVCLKLGTATVEQAASLAMARGAVQL
ncbi:helix-turn-helix transcriptional regulator [Alloyangia pacifica]|uniref:helix-turn-helix transcriptional regulator n=1 Tax=Alloyangia pacifica TaxID=311180 RepID=UPI001CD7E7EB|nr:autoinducer binding domain-containing protein [Alloyangia pacifica]MCA0998515.1 autoinducer binding domain-containing protein [Alloyangia pacifica]